MTVALDRTRHFSPKVSLPRKTTDARGIAKGIGLVSTGLVVAAGVMALTPAVPFAPIVLAAAGILGAAEFGIIVGANLNDAFNGQGDSGRAAWEIGSSALGFIPAGKIGEGAGKLVSGSHAGRMVTDAAKETLSDAAKELAKLQVPEWEPTSPSSTKPCR